MVAEHQFEPKISPQEEVKWLGERVVESPEKAKEIIEEHLRRKPEQVYAQEHTLSFEEREQIESRVLDVKYKEKEKIMRELFQVVEEKGLLNAAQIAKNLDPSLMDDFHRQLVLYLNQKENEK